MAKTPEESKLVHTSSFLLLIPTWSCIFFGGGGGGVIIKIGGGSSRIRTTPLLCLTIEQLIKGGV